jgi:hypothetical protein
VGASDFLTPLRLEYLDGRDWKVIREFRYRSEDAIERVVRVPRGFVTDFASIPRFLWRVLPPTGKYGKAAVIHDFLYRTQACTRAEADAVFLEAMTDLSVGFWRRHAMHVAVRLFGSRAYIKKIESCDDGPGAL